MQADLFHRWGDGCGRVDVGSGVGGSPRTSWETGALPVESSGKANLRDGPWVSGEVWASWVGWLPV